MVTTGRSLSDAEVLAIQNQARQPLVRIEAVFAAFFLPPSLVIVLLLGLGWARVALSATVIAIVLVLAFLPPIASMARTLRRSERRNELLSDLAKFQEHMREQSEITEEQR
jgi:pilus assembly protein TadC